MDLPSRWTTGPRVFQKLSSLEHRKGMSNPRRTHQFRVSATFRKLCTKKISYAVASDVTNISGKGRVIDMLT
jgi:hypothetical protein